MSSFFCRLDSFGNNQFPISAIFEQNYRIFHVLKISLFFHQVQCIFKLLRSLSLSLTAEHHQNLHSPRFFPDLGLYFKVWIYTLKKPIQEFQVGHIKRGHTETRSKNGRRQFTRGETQQKKQSALESGN